MVFVVPKEYGVNELARLGGVSARAVRYYESLGLLLPVERQPGQPRRFGVGDVLDLVRIRRMSDLGLRLEQIKTLLDEPESPGAADIGEQLYQSLAEELESIKTRQEVLTVLATRGVPLDSAPGRADELAQLRDVVVAPTAMNLGRAILDLIDVMGSDEEKAKYWRLVTATNTAAEAELERRILELDGDSRTETIEEVGQLWGRQLIALYEADEGYRALVDHAATKPAVDDLMEQALNEAQRQARSIARGRLEEFRNRVESAQTVAPAGRGRSVYTAAGRWRRP